MGMEKEVPDLGFLKGSSTVQLRTNEVPFGVDVRLGDAEVIFSDGKIVRVSLIDKEDVGDRKAFPEDGNRYRRIKMLSMINCRVQQKMPRYLAELKQLVHLDLSRNGILGGIDHLDFPHKLRFIRISDNPLEGSVNRLVEELPSLEFLDIGNTNLRIDPLLIAGNRSLNKISFYSENIQTTQATWETQLRETFSVNKFLMKGAGGAERIFYSVNRKASRNQIDGRPAVEVMEELRKLFMSDQDRE